MRVPIINGIYTDENSDFRTSYPVNMVPVPKKQGMSNGYLRSADGIVALGSGGPGIDRGGINWNGVHYRVMGNYLVSIDEVGTVTDHGFIAGTDQVTLDYSFDYLGIAGGGNLYLWNGVLKQVEDTDLGTVNDMIWIDGYFMTTDGEYLVVTELNDPFSVNPLKYGSSEVDPDSVIALLKLRNEVYALNRYTIEIFGNVGGSLFPFQRITGAHIERGTIGTHSCCVFLESISFLGGGRNESPAIWTALNGNTTKISTREIDQILSKYTESQLKSVVLESHTDKGHRQLYIHLSDQTLVYDAAASLEMQIPVWFKLNTNGGQYRAKNIVWVNDKWMVGDPLSSAIGELSFEVSSHWGIVNRWEFNTTILYNEGQGAIFHELELECLTGRGVQSTIFTDYSLDGVTWSQPIASATGVHGERQKRIVWFQQGIMKTTRIQRFKGASDSHISAAVLQIRLERLMF